MNTPPYSSGLGNPEEKFFPDALSYHFASSGSTEKVLKTAGKKRRRAEKRGCLRRDNLFNVCTVLPHG